MHDLIYKNRPVITLGADEEVGPPNHPIRLSQETNIDYDDSGLCVEETIGTMSRLHIRHRNGPEGDPNEEGSDLPQFAEFGSIDNIVNEEALLALSSQTAFPYLDFDRDHHYSDPNEAVLFYYAPTGQNDDTGATPANRRYAFWQYWFYYPASYTVYLTNGFTHVGDWKMVQLTVRQREPDDPATEDSENEDYSQESILSDSTGRLRCGPFKLGGAFGSRPLHVVFAGTL